MLDFNLSRFGPDISVESHLAPFELPGNLHRGDFGGSQSVDGEGHQDTSFC